MKLQTKIPRSLLVLLLGMMTSHPGLLRAKEDNVWPFWVGQTEANADRSMTDSWSAVGPLFFRTDTSFFGSSRQSSKGFRPLFVEKSDSAQSESDFYFLYPLFSYRESPTGYRWSLFSLINLYRAKSPAPESQGAISAHPEGGFDLWPFYFSRETGDPTTSYKAVMPLYGHVCNRFGMDRISWTLFPIYARAEKRHVITTAVLWPFFRTMEGQGNHGITFWPLFGIRSKEGAYREQFYLWPLIYKDEHALWQQEPDVSFGALPFYASERTSMVKSETFVGPFFGYTDRSHPYQYHEVRYFWPFFVQGRGDDIYINRWGPFYTHSVRKGVDKTWVLWPLWCHREWTESGLAQSRNQFLWFVYHSTVQHSAKHPELPAAHKTHLWPLVSSWDNGAGQKQVQALSLFSALFPYNEPIQIAYDPLFALYRYDQRSPEDRKHTFFWNLVSWHRAPGQTEFHLGPILGVDTEGNARRVAFGCGLFGFEREEADGRWKFFFCEFKPQAGKPANHQP